MAFAYTQDEMMFGLGGDEMLVTGTFTNTASGTGGAITIQGAASVKFFGGTPTVNATAVYYSVSGNVVTITTGSNEVGTWMAIVTSA